MKKLKNRFDPNFSKMRKIVIIILLNCLSCASLFCADIGTRLQNAPKSLWNMPANGIQEEFNLYGKCKWKDNTKSHLLFKYAPDKRKVYFFKQQIYKTSFRFINKKKNPKSTQHINAIYLTLKKTSSEIEKGTYLENIDSLKNQIKGIGQLSKLRESKRKFGKWYRCSYVWKSLRYSVSLKWGYSQDSKAPFKIKSTKFSIFYNGTYIVSKTKDIAKKTVNKSELKINGAVASNGDFYLNVPMSVETSSKNSLSTSVSRVMKYYAQEAAKKSSTQTGIITDPKKYVYNFLNPANVRYDIKDLLKRSFRVKEIMSPKYFDDYIKFSSLIYAYNGYAKNKLEGQYNKTITSSRRLRQTNYILMKNVIRKSKTGTAIFVNTNGKKAQSNTYKETKVYVYLINMIEIILRMNDEDAWIKMHCRRKSKVKKFKKKICKQIIAGKPVLWDVILGIVKEKNAPQVKGKYVRIIIGYNDKTNEVIYSDSLGKGHEIKKISWDKAWAITCKTLTLAEKKRF